MPADRVLLLTGSRLVPAIGTTLLPGDTVVVDIAGVGRVTNSVVLEKHNVVLTPQTQ